MPAKPIFPERSKTVYLERLGKEITLYEMTVGFRIKIADSDGEISKIEVLEDAGMDKDDILSIGEHTLDDLYDLVIELSYPGIAENEEREPTVSEIEESKKNS